ncbi:MAG: hypothetical protein M0027_01045 [Candidatus Dormibacteraeota bacterium]|jgi:hypothetical protein|nr:hypothetical protein [Candidatus Dormibacteraeota bacterium]
MAAKKHVTVEGGHSKAVLERLRQIAQAHPRHALTVRAVRADAEDPSSPLHKLLQWDDAIAGRRWRDSQIRQIIATVHVRIVTPAGPLRVRAYANVRAADGSHEYHRRDTTVADVLQAAEEDIRNELLGLVQRWATMPNFWQVVDAVLTEARQSKVAA